MKTPQEMLRGLAAVLCLVMLAACGGGGGGSDGAEAPAVPLEAPPQRTAYAVDDFVVGGSVRILRLSDNALLHQTVSGEMGRIGWPAGLSGAVRIEVTGGNEDIDGLNATTEDRKPFGGKLSTLVDIGNVSAPLVLSAMSTALVDASGNDLAAFNGSAAALPAELRQLLDLNGVTFESAQMRQRLQALSMLTRTVGFDSTRAALAEAPNSANFEAVRQLAAQVGSTAPIGRITDLALRNCVAEALATDAQQVSLAQIATLSDLACARAGVVSLEGLELLSGLHFLNLAGNDISDPRPLRTLAQLEFADLADNRIRSIAPLFDGLYTELGLRITRNCIADLSETTGRGPVVISTVDLHARQQYSSCDKADAELVALRLTVVDGVHQLLVRTTYNPAARCQIDWGDGSPQTVPCDGRAVRYRHTYTGQLPSHLRFLINGQVRAQTALPTIGPVLGVAGAGNDRDALIAPNGGEAWWNGQVQTVRWMTQYITGPSVDLYILWDSPSGLEDKTNRDIGVVVNTKRWYRFAAAVPNTGSYEVDPADFHGTGNAYRILVVSTADRSKFDLSDENVYLNEAAPPPPAVTAFSCTSPAIVGTTVSCAASGSGLASVTASISGQPVEVTTFASSDTSLAVTFRVLASGAVQVNLLPRPASATVLASQAVTVTPSTP
jgi:hypothetical protein